MLIGEAANINFIIVSLTRQWLKPMIHLRIIAHWMYDKFPSFILSFEGSKKYGK
jgi:hypothetical protein